MDEEAEMRKAKMLLFGLAFFGLSCFLVYDEFAYLVWGRKTDATITKVFESSSGAGLRSRGSSMLVVEYTFTEPDGTSRRGSTNVRTDWPGPRTGTVPVQYTPGDLGRTRIVGQGSWFFIVLFVAALVVMAILGYQLWLEANEDVRPKKSKR